MNIIFWQNIPSIHQAPLLREGAKKHMDKVTVVAEKDVASSRLKQGWGNPDFSPAKLLVSPTIICQEEILERSGRDAVHIFSGFHAYPQTFRIFQKAIQKGGSVGVFAEPGPIGSIKDIFRICKYRLHAMRWSRYIDFLLVTGQLGVNFYLRSGFKASKVFPFAYFVESLDSYDIQSPFYDYPDTSSESNLNLLFAGQLIKRKGLDLLLSALSKISKRAWVLNVIGHGPELKQLKYQAAKFKIAEQVHWLGPLPNQEVRNLMLKSDCFALPSRFDGWGAVVNEALLAGTPAIVSDACGSCDLIQAPWLGDVFSAGSTGDLANVINLRIANGPLKNKVRKRVRKWADQAISPQKGADYLFEIITFNKSGKTGQRPIAPWRKPIL